MNKQEGTVDHIYPQFTPFFLISELSVDRISNERKEREGEGWKGEKKVLSVLVWIEKRAWCWQLNALIFFWELGLSYWLADKDKD